ncbi:hypothetical protein ACTI_50310 [Actinoplanes sp. OR16]|uniref:HEXXH motif domain-containing protein n=1 Tax=Actinoplanes sp. OR16 TaxID=946334 RepID=UPI000F6EEF64|nr:HEXXH motif domain-containing protein [Actinoplanes sp. OR16]BBH68346.1 hypothetical protein ACTI_50310 [Actinoplanes sp. OR16]
MIAKHRIPRAAYDALCAGAADRTGLAALDAAQLSKHLLLLRMVVEQLAGSPGRTVAGEALRLLEEVRRHHRPAFETALLYPYVGAGLAGCLRSLRADGDTATVAGFLARVAVTAAAHAGREATLDRVPVSGPMHLPALGTVTAVPAAGVVSLTTSAYRITAGEVSVDLAAPRHDRPGWIPVRPLTTEAGRARPLFDDVDPYREASGLTVGPRPVPTEFSRWRDRFAGADALLSDRHPQRAEQVAALVRAVTPLAVLLPGQGRSVSAWQAYGAVSLTLPADASSFAVTLIHESQHSIFNAMLDLVDLYDPADRRVYYSPWRADPRPLRGLLHGCYAFAAVAEYWSVECAVPGAEPQAAYEAARAAIQVRQALDTLDGVASLTADGRHVVAQLRQRLEALGTQAPMRTAGHLAGLACDDHRLSWRLRVLLPHADAVGDAARAWLEGGVPRGLGGTARTADTVDTFVPNERASRLGHLARHGRVGTPTGDADAYLADHDYQAAAEAYLVAIRSDGDDLNAWTGLAMAGSRRGGAAAHVWSHRPEFVRAVYKRLAATPAPPPDPLTLAEWLADGSGG